MFCSDPIWPKARKPHICSGCGHPIPAGETYAKWTSFDAGTADTVKMHSECHEALCAQAADEGGGPIEFTPFELDPPERLAPKDKP